MGLPQREGLYDPQFEHDACGVGFVVNIKGEASHRIVEQALQVLVNLEHRGASGSDPDTGDGAGILLQIPHTLFIEDGDVPLPDPGYYGVGMVFLPRDPVERRVCRTLIEQTVEEEGQLFLGWRNVPVDNTQIGAASKSVEPVIRQFYVGRGEGVDTDDTFERRLYVIRKRIERAALDLALRQASYLYVCSLSSRTIVYKGLLLARQIGAFYKDLVNPKLTSALALVHQRFSTNTFPTWDLAHPYRMLAHNGEINTLRGNRNWMRARASSLYSEELGGSLDRLQPLISETGSDSATLDNALELLVMGGRSLPHAMLMLVPEAWSTNDRMDPERRAFYEYHACMMEPWDGPAAIAFTDGRVVGALLDRNGLRPARYVVTRDNLVVMASEAGVLDIPADRIREKWRLQPGKVLLVDTLQGRIIGDNELKDTIVSRQPYSEWLDDNRLHITDLPDPVMLSGAQQQPLEPRLRLFGYTQEDLDILIRPMCEKGEEPIGSMGNDTPLAVLSPRPQLLYNYFKQLFAQVTNPPIDPIREDIVMSLEYYVGKGGNLLSEAPEQCQQLHLDSPILSNVQLERLRQIETEAFQSRTVAAVFARDGGPGALEQALDAVCAEVDAAVADGVSIVILSDRSAGPDKTPIPALLACAAVHHHLVRQGSRASLGLVIESGEPREVMHFALLLGYGASAVNPYLVYELIGQTIRDGRLPGISLQKACRNYAKAVNKGILKTMSKMGISTLQSYRGAQIFEAVGLHAEVIDRYFTHTPSRISGARLDVIAREALMRHQAAWPAVPARGNTPLDPGGAYKWRRAGEYHQINPETIAALQFAVRSGDYAKFKMFSQEVNAFDRQVATLRGLLKFRKREPVPLDEVEPIEQIMRRFVTGAMSLGSISTEAHETLAIAMNRIGGKSNTGEGGEDPVRFSRDANGDWRRSAIKQVASARFGVTTHYLVNADELQIKMAQGAKPGEGGQLPGHKVDRYIGRLRHSTPGVTLISPPPHHDIYSIEDLAQLIYDLKNVNPAARISVKLVSEVGVGTVAAGVAKAHADHVLISGHDGGTGASPLSSIKHAGLPWELGLAETQQVLVKNRLRSRIIVQTDGQLKTGRDVVVAALLGAEEFGFATIALVSMGCIMMRVCHNNTCPAGIATQDPELRRRFAGKPEHVVNLFRFIAEETREYMAELGFRTMDEMIGRSDVLEPDIPEYLWKASDLDLQSILHQPQMKPASPLRCVESQNHGLEAALDNTLIERCRAALERGDAVKFELPVRNSNRTVGAMLSGEVARRWGADALPDATIQARFRGTAGQSFGAFLNRGIEFTLEGDANDYLGKGLSGGRIIAFPDREAAFDPAENIIAGNTLLYGATSGEVYLRGVVGERFAVRNSGAHAVVEGVGDHGCEYMTGGVVVVLGKTGRNFAAGMSGGVAFVLDQWGQFRQNVNRGGGSILLEAVTDPEDVALLRRLVEAHLAYTHSTRARDVLARWDDVLSHFIKVISKEYKTMLAVLSQEEAQTERKEVVTHG